MEHLCRTNTHHMYTHSVKRWVHLDRVEAERWSILAGQTHTTCTHILSKDGPDKHTPQVLHHKHKHTITMTTDILAHLLGEYLSSQDE